MTIEQAALYVRRRERMMESMGQGSVGVWMSPPVRVRNHDVDYLYRQTSDILYLSGCAEPEAVLVLCPERPEGERSVLFVRPRDVDREIWFGRRLGPERAREHYGVDVAYSVEELDKKLPDLLGEAERLFLRTGLEPEQDRRALEWLEQVKRKRRLGVVTPSQIVDPSRITDEMRLYKDDVELAWMRKAASINMAAHKAAMAAAKPGMHEYELAALLHYSFERQGCTGTAYQSIVGGGENATILHYTENQDPLRDGELVLIDAGCEWNYYASDITRTFPVNGRFTSMQRDVYQIVLEALDAAIAVCKPGALMQDVHQAALRCLTQGLISLKVLEGDLEKLLSSRAYETFYMHRTSHWLGLDVHDAGGYYDAQGNHRVLQPGMVLTVEPGLYFHSYHDVQSAEPFRGIGIRIEDNILITPEGHENLTLQTPRTIEQVEVACGG
ncbi:MAG: aminopeptidase P N-terminal domain-containing protein [Myxococcales bacterium]|nr:aminopeptidase P N-terminal domain-containing protein [Myxococcales bacterium]